MRNIVVAAAQLGPIQRADSRAVVVQRLLALLESAARQGAKLVVYPELALTTFFPRWYMEDRAEVDRWFEPAMPSAPCEPLFARAKELGIGFSLGYAELTSDGRHFNTQILVDPVGTTVGKYRKVPLPGHAELDPSRAFQHLEKRYFLPGDLGFPVWRTMGGVMGMLICNDRRWPEAWRVLGMQGVELVILGYNTPSVNSQKAAEGTEQRLFHNRLVVQAGCYQNSCWGVAVAKAGDEDGHPLIGGSLIVDPDGRIVAEAKTEADELLVAEMDLDATRFGKETIFAFDRHRRIEHYGLITRRAGAVPPPE